MEETKSAYHAINCYNFTENDTDQVLSAYPWCSDSTTEYRGTCDEDPPTRNVNEYGCKNAIDYAPTSTQHTQPDTKTNSNCSPHEWTCLLQELANVESLSRA